MKQSLQLKLHQQLALTPQLQQSIRLLQLSTLELSQEISQILQDNPMLERLDRNDGGDEAYEPGAEAPSEAPEGPTEGVYEELAWGDRPVAPAGDDDGDEREFQTADRAGTSLQQHLADQLALMPLTRRDRQLLALLVEALDDDGYLSASLAELAELLPAELEIEPEELSTALRLLQSLDPVGVGARDLAECLLLQLNALPAATPHLATAQQLVRQHLPLLGDREYGKLKKLLGIDGDRDFIAVRQLITSLDPRPGARYAQVDTQYVVPDVVVRKQKGSWVASLNPQAMPRLRINEMYASILRQNREGGSALSGQLQEARWLIKNVQQRFQTILRVAQAIVERQRLFFEHGEIAMRPLILREIAEELGLHESTISRVTNQKYMMTPRGLYEFKYFFGSALATEAGGAASSTAIKALIRQYVDAESRAKPMSDQAISEMLGEQGYMVARRTVAKYREQMNIPPANQRKSL
jgi:RNA polymerase sigma-54 factor